MLAKFVVVVLLGLAAAAPEEERERQTKQLILPGQGCTSYYYPPTNPCQSGAGTYYAINGDPAKFIQCDALGRAYVVQCPNGLYYNAAATSCQAPNANPIGFNNGPCTAQAIQTGRLYFPYPGDNTRFYSCTTGIGQDQVLHCPNNLVFDSALIACVYAQGTYPQYPQGGNNLLFQNPCTAQQIAGRHYYFAHPDPTKFIQCDDNGRAFVVACPSGLLWNQYLETCGSAYAQIFGSFSGK